MTPHLAARLSTLALLAGLCACSSTDGPDWGRALPPGAPALIPLGPDEPRPDFAADWDNRETITAALDRSIEWTTKISAPRFFPIEGVSHERALASLKRFRELLATSADPDAFAATLDREFQIYKSAGWDGEGGGVLFTGYCTPILDGSKTKSAEYRYPLYSLPPDLVKDKEGNILGQQTAGGLNPEYPDRRTIERTRMLEGKGLELVYLRDPVDAFLAHVNGSAFIRLKEGGMFKLGYAGKNGQPYTSLRKELVLDGQIEENGRLASIRAWAAEHPELVPEYLDRNASYVFFTPIEGTPRGSLNVEVTGNRTLATDKSLFPRGAVCFVDTQVGSGREFRQFMFDQDTGGAIRTAGRADIYLGSGAAAERLAGSTEQEGQLYYLFLKDEGRVSP